MSDVIQECPRCGNKIDHQQKLIKYYAKGKPVYEIFCKKCVGDMWKYMYKEYKNHPNFWELF